jgi:TonB-dependent starch-binding outer membrane protein SusC
MKVNFSMRETFFINQQQTKGMKLTANPALGFFHVWVGSSGAKLVRVMRLTTIIILAACLQTSANGLAQNTVTFSGKDVNLESVFTAIKKQTSYRFFFNTTIIQNASKITIEVKNAPIEQVMNLALKDQSLTFAIKGRTIFIMKKQEEEKGSGQVAPVTGDSVTVRGTVTDEQGNPLAGANVKVKGTNNGGTTDGLGRFTLTNVNENGMLEISFVGRESQLLPVKGKTVLTVALGKKQSVLDETVVIAYGTTTKRFNTGNVSSVSSSEIEKQPVTNLLFAIAGRVPGLVISQANGLPGGAATIRIQGQNSISNGNEPFYVVDGVPYAGLMLPTSGITLDILGGARGSVNGSGNPLSYINPSDVESITVLKGADATAIYGSRAANGAILINTKKGKIGQTKIDLNLQQGWGKVASKLDMMNTEQYLAMRKEAKANDNVAINSTDYDINGQWDTTRNIDWQKELIGKTAQFTNLSGNISGGTTNSQYIAGGTFQRQTSVFPGNFDDQKVGLHFNLNSSTSNQKFRFQLSGNYLIDKNLLPSGDLTSSAINLAPNAPSLYNPDGSLNWQLTSTGTNTWTNPLDKTLREYSNKTNNLIGNAVLNYQILPSLEIKSSFGYNRLESDEFSGSPLISVAPSRRATFQRGAIFGNSIINSWIIEPQLSYQARIVNGKLNALIGTTFQKNNNSGKTIIGTGYNSDAVLKDILSASSLSSLGSIESEYKYNAVFGRLNYNLADKYILNLSIRRDGSSRFGSDNLFQNFGAVGTAWIFSQENFMKKFKFLSFGKLRASYGTAGNDQIGDYSFMSLYNAISVTVPYQGITSVEPSGLSNPGLQWEQKRSLDMGLQLGFLDEKVSISANYTVNSSSNQLIGYRLPMITGFSSITTNFQATVQNRVWEFEISSLNVQAKKFSWKTSFNLTVPTNELTKFPGLEVSSYADILVMHQPLSVIKSYHFLGVDPTTGAYTIADKNGNPTTTPTVEDKTVIINTLPKYYGGLQNSITYGGFQLDFLFQFVKQTGQNYFGGSARPGSRLLNQPISVLNRWQKPGDETRVQRYSSNAILTNQYNWMRSSEVSYSDASFIRLKNISLSYQLPEKWRKTARLKNCNVFVHGQNLITITDFDGLDPETGQGILPALPPLKMITVGLHVTF